MAPATYLDDVGALLAALGARGFHLTLVGGMALVTLGSRRVTRDFDFLMTNPGNRLDDLLFDFPLPAAPIAARAQRLRVASHRLSVAAEPDLLALKRLALTARTRPGDADDVAFLEARQRTRRK